MTNRVSSAICRQFASRALGFGQAITSGCGGSIWEQAFRRFTRSGVVFWTSTFSTSSSCADLLDGDEVAHQAVGRQRTSATELTPSPGSVEK
jgi:hypothetical protein